MRLERAASRAYSIEDLRRAAQARLPRAIFDFFEGGAEDEITLRENSEALKKIRLLPRVLRDVSTLDTGLELLGKPASLPMAIAPTGALGYGRPGADLAIAKAASAAGIPYSLSSSATVAIETIARQAPGRHWFQAYILSNKPFLASLIERAKAADFEALMITVDLPVGGKRERDFRNDFKVPFSFTRRNLWDFAQHPGWAYLMLKHGMPVMENLIGLEASTASQIPGVTLGLPARGSTAQNLPRQGPTLRGSTAQASAIASSVGRNYDASFDWAALQKIRDQWSRKMIVKGVVHPADALRLAAMGVDAVVVSNHGGRQLDAGIATFDALPAVVAAVQGKVPIWMDGGIRRGSDIVKALACGAQAVLIGRATLFGAVAYGEAGAHRALHILQDELRRTMQLTGASSLAEISRELLTPASTTTHNI
jgi:(S)-mandelate dehydrogenase